MNKKLKFYSGLFLFSILFVVAFAVFTPTDKPHYSRLYIHDNVDSMPTVERDANPLVTTKSDTTYQVVTDSLGEIDTVDVSISRNWRPMWFDVNLRKRSHTNSPIIYATNSATMGLMYIDKAQIHFRTTRYFFVKMSILTVVVAIVYLIGLIWVIRLIVRVIKNIRKGNIFVSQMAVDLERLGILMTIFFVIGFIVQIVVYFTACGIHFEDYQVVFGPINRRAWLIAGTGLMLLSQIFSMGKDLKEDVDLTV